MLLVNSDEHLALSSPRANAAVLTDHLHTFSLSSQFGQRCQQLVTRRLSDHTFLNPLSIPRCPHKILKTTRLLPGRNVPVGI
jgi:hypothetical protein